MVIVVGIGVRIGTAIGIVIAIVIIFDVYIASEGAPIQERMGQANERYGLGAMRSRPPQTVHHQENQHALLDHVRRSWGGARVQAGTVSMAGGIFKSCLDELDEGLQGISKKKQAEHGLEK